MSPLLSEERTARNKGHNLAFSFVYAPYSLDSGDGNLLDRIHRTGSEHIQRLHVLQTLGAHPELDGRHSSIAEERESACDSERVECVCERERERGRVCV